MKRILAVAFLAVLLFATVASAGDLEQCCAHAGGLHGRVCCALEGLIDWWSF